MVNGSELLAFSSTCGVDLELIDVWGTHRNISVPEYHLGPSWATTGSVEFMTACTIQYTP